MPAMAGSFDIEILRSRLIAIMAARNIKPTSLSLAVGASPSLVKDLLEKTADVKLSTLARLADRLGVTIESLTGSGIQAIPFGPTLFVKGNVAAGVWREAFELPETEWQTFYGRSDVAADLDHRFGLRIVGDSMDMVYPHGSIVECVSLFGRAEAVPGKRVVVVRTNQNYECEATVKELVEQDGELWLVPRSYNPAHRPWRMIDRDDGITDIAIVAVVVASIRPE